MPRLELHNALGKVLESHELDPHEPLADNLMRIWPQGHPGFTPILQDAEGVIIPPSEAVAELPSGDYHLVLLPQSGVEIALFVLAVVSIAASVILTPTQPSVQTQDYEWEEGSSNFAANQTNKLRPGARVPDVFGKMRVYPDLIAEPYSRYFGRDQKLFELFVISNGDVEISDVRLHADSFDENYDGTIEVLKPGDKIPFNFRIVTPNLTVSNLELPAENESFSSAIGLDFDSAAGTISADQYIWEAAWDTKLIFVDDTIDADNSKVYTVTDQSLESAGAPFSIDVTPSPGTTRNDDGSAVYYALADTKYTAPRASSEQLYEVLPAGQDEPVWYAALNKDDVILVDDGASGYTQHRVKKKSAQLNIGPTNQIQFTHSIYSVFLDSGAPGGGDPVDYWILADSIATEPDDDAGGFRNWTSWFSCPNDDATDLWFDFAFRKGLYRQNAGEIPRNREVKIDYQYRLVGSSSVAQESVTYSDRTRNLIKFSKRVRNLAPGKYEMRFRRVTLFEAETASKLTIDEVTLERLAGARQPKDRKLPNVTAVLLELNTQINNIEGTRKFNCIASRRLPDYSTGKAVGLEETDRISDAVAYTLIEQAGYDPDAIDLATLYDRFDGASQDFRGVIDQEMSADDQVAFLLSVGNGYAYRRAGVIYFVRDRVQTIPRTLFNRRNKVRPESKSMSFGQLDDPDAVEVTYFDQDDGYKQNVVTYPENVTPVRPKKIQLIGKTQFNKAWRRAKREYDLIRLRKDTLQLVATEEGALLGPGDLIAVTDHLRADPPIDGEVLSGAAKSLVVDIDASDAKAGDIIWLRNKDGVTLQETTIASASGNSIVLQNNITVEPSDDPAASNKVLFGVVNDSDAPKEKWLVQMVRPAEDGSVLIECVNYDEGVYDADTDTPPAPPFPPSEP